MFASQVSNAQTEKGTETIGANIGFSYTNASDFTVSVANGSTSTLDTKTTTFNIGPIYSYFIADKLDIGAALTYSSSTLKNMAGTYATTNDSYPTKQSSDNFSTTLFIRKYFMYQNKIGFRTEGFLGYSHQDNTNTYAPSFAGYNYDNETDYYSAGTNLDLVYYPSKKLGVSATIATLEYYHYTANNANQGHDSGDNITFNFVNSGLSLSVFYVFGSK